MVKCFSVPEYDYNYTDECDECGFEPDKPKERLLHIKMTQHKNFSIKKDYLEIQYERINNFALLFGGVIGFFLIFTFTSSLRYIDPNLAGIPSSIDPDAINLHPIWYWLIITFSIFSGLISGLLFNFYQERFVLGVKSIPIEPASGKFKLIIITFLVTYCVYTVLVLIRPFHNMTLSWTTELSLVLIKDFVFFIYLIMAIKFTFDYLIAKESKFQQAVFQKNKSKI